MQEPGKFSQVLITLAIIGFICAMIVALLPRANGNQPAPQENKPIIHPEKPIGDLTGIYECRGTEKAGKTYAGSVNIIKREDIYVVSWNIGATHFAGVGVRVNDQLSVGWCAQTPSGLTRGVNVYTIKNKGKKLVGYWSTLPGDGAKNTETLSYLKEFEVGDE